MNNRKAVTAIIDGKLYIDASDVKNINIDAVKKEIKENLGKDVSVVVAPINTWMPDDGASVLMEHATRTYKTIEHATLNPFGYFGNNRHARRAIKAKMKK